MSVTIETSVHFSTGRAGQKRMRSGPKAPPMPLPQHVPRISRLMALAIHFDELIRQGIVRDYADLARLGGVTRARITQIMNLLNLPSWKQEEILFLHGGQGRDRLTERQLRQFTVSGKWPNTDSCVDGTRDSQQDAATCIA